MSMSLLERVERIGTDENRIEEQPEHRQLLIHLREEVYRRLTTQFISRIIAQGRERAVRELEEVVRVIFRGAEFRDLGSEELDLLRRELVDMIVGFGPIEELMEDESVTEVMVNGPDAVFFERDGQLFPSPISFIDDEQLRMLIDRIVGPRGRRVDEQSPFASVRLPQGHRVNIIIAPLAVNGPYITIRKFRSRIFTLGELVAAGSIDDDLAVFLRWAVQGRLSMAVSGGTGSGKTTLLNALSVEIPEQERIITIEDAAELRFQTHPHVVSLETRPMNAEGTGEVTIRELIANALRMRPDRIIVGECRGPEALDMLQAMNTGHEGSATTLHANSPQEAISRLEMMVRWGMDLPIPVIEEQIASALDLIIQLNRFPDGSRRLTDIVSCGFRADGVELETILSLNRKTGTYEWHSLPSWVDELPYRQVASREEVARWKARCFSAAR